MSVTYSQLRQLVELTGGEKDGSGIQNLLASGGLVKKIAIGEISQATQGVANPYAASRVKPAYFYPEGYKPNSVEKQVQTLLERLGDLDSRHVAKLAEGWDLARYPQADGLYVEPKPTSCARVLKIEDPYGAGWGTLLEQGPLAALAATRRFRNWREGELTPNRFRILPSAASALLYLEYIQPGDFLVYPSHTGLPFAGFSVLDARWEIRHAEDSEQWPRPAASVGWNLFTNPHRLEKFEHLAIDCPGDEFLAGLGGEFGFCPYFFWGGDELRFSTDWIGLASDSFGSASSFR